MKSLLMKQGGGAAVTLGVTAQEVLDVAGIVHDTLGIAVVAVDEHDETGSGHSYPHVHAHQRVRDTGDTVRSTLPLKKVLSMQRRGGDFLLISFFSFGNLLGYLYFCTQKLN